MELKGTIEGIELRFGNKAEYKVKSAAKAPGVGYFYFTFTAVRGQHEIGDKVKITVEAQ